MTPVLYSFGDDGSVDVPYTAPAAMPVNDMAAELAAEGFVTPAQLQATPAPLPVMIDQLPVAQYGALAFDLAMKTAPLAQIMDVYGLTEAGLTALIDTPAFKDAVADAKAQLAEHGPIAGFVIRSRFIAEDLLTDMFQLAKSATTDSALRFKIFQGMAQYARVDPATTKQKGDQGSGGVNVVLNFGSGIRGIGPQVQVIEQ